MKPCFRKKDTVTYRPNDVIWIGLKYIATEKKWKWSDGTEYKVDQTGQWKDYLGSLPNYLPSDACVALEIWSQPSGQVWYLKPCNGSTYYSWAMVICQKEAKSMSNI